MSRAEEKTLNRYLEDAGSLSRLTPEEETELFKKLEERRLEGDIKSAEELEERIVNANLLFVVSTVKEYTNEPDLMNELIQEGNIGLMRAVKRFDYRKGFRLTSYSVWWIRQAVLTYFYKNSGVMRLPMGKRELLKSIRRMESKLAQEESAFPTSERIAEELKVETREVEKALIIESAPTSLQAPRFLHDKSGDELGNSIKADDGNPADVFEEREIRKGVEELVLFLPEREAEVVRMYFGVGKDRSYTLDEIGKRFGLTRERIRQIKERALERFCHPARRRLISKLKSYYIEG